MLDVKDLSKIYETGDQALDQVSLSVEGNNTVAIIGPSGAGKSTLIRCINRLVEPTSGEVWLDDVELTSLSKSELRKERRNIGMVFQNYGLVERLTVMENVLSGRLGYVSFLNSFRREYPSDDVKHAYDVLERVGLAGFENKRVDELSGGQRQRVGIARAVIQRPKLMLVDEPTSSLDPETSHDVMELLTEIADESNIPVLINIHEVHLAEEFSDRIVGLSDGRIVFDGTVEELTDDAKDTIYRSEDPPEPQETATVEDGPEDESENVVEDIKTHDG